MTFSLHLRPHRRPVPGSINGRARRRSLTHIVFGLLIFIALLVGSSFLLVWLALLFAQGLPAITQDLANLTCDCIRDEDEEGSSGRIPKLMPGLSSRTFSRCSFAKNMYAERPRLGAFGSATVSLEVAVIVELAYPSSSSRHRDPWS